MRVAADNQTPRRDQTELVHQMMADAVAGRCDADAGIFLLEVHDALLQTCNLTVGTGGVAYVKFIKPNQGVKVSADPDNYDFEDEEYLTEDVADFEAEVK